MARLEPTRLWFVNGDGIDRSVISGDIQRYLGNDATVRPGLGTGENEGVPGYWIKAFRNLTSYQLEDLRIASAKWQQEQRRGPTGMKEGYKFDTTSDTPADQYVGSHTYHSAGGRSGRGAGDSPIPSDSVYNANTGVRRETRAPPHARRAEDAMDVEPPYPVGPERRFEEHRYDNSRPYTQDRPSHSAGGPQYADQPGYRGPPPLGQMPYGTDSRMDTRMDTRMDGRMPPQYAGNQNGPNYSRPPPDHGYYAPSAGSYQGNGMSSQMPPQYANGHYGGPPPSQGQRSTERDRYGPPPGAYQEQQYYPSPPLTISEPRNSASNSVPPSGYQAQNSSQMQPQYDYNNGRPPPAIGTMYAQGQAPSSGAYTPGQGAQFPPGQSSQAGQRPPGQRPIPPSESNIDPRDPRRRRLNGP